ncbi:PRP45_2 [Sanghuangporus vaninii]
MAALASLLPKPVFTPVVSDDEDVDEKTHFLSSSMTIVTRQPVPPYGKRKGWKPTSQADFGDGGAYPKCRVARYPQEGLVGRRALEEVVNGKIKSSSVKNAPGQGNSSFIRYTPGQQGGANGLKQRIIKMSEVAEDPLDFKHKKIPFNGLRIGSR